MSKSYKRYLQNEERFGIVSQLGSVTASISSNLAEETSRKTNKYKAHFTGISYSSTMEVLNQLIIFKELGVISENETILAKNFKSEKTHRF